MTGMGVLCIGDLDVDFFISVPTVPGFDQKVAGVNHGYKPGGMSANSAVALARLGLKSRLLAAVGSDAAGELAIRHLTTEGVDLDFLARRDGVETFVCVILLSPSGEKSLIKLETEAYLPSPDDLAEAAFEGVRHVHVTYGSPGLTLRALRFAAARGLSTSLDLEPPDILRHPATLATVLPLVDTLFLNREALDAASMAVGSPLDATHLRRGGEMIVTLGAAGCRRVAADGPLAVPGFAVNPVDTTGAGDCFAGAYLAEKLRGEAPADCLRFANAAAALATLDYGAQSAMPHRSEVEALLSGHRPPEQQDPIISGMRDA